MSDSEAAALQAAIIQASIPGQVWLQWPGEPDDLYACFLIYLSLGTGRSLDKAYQVEAINNQKMEAVASGDERAIVIPRKASGAYWKWAADWHWTERAMKYDVYMLSQLVPQTVQIIFETITEFARVTLQQLRDGNIRPEDWSEVKEAVQTLAGYISPEIIQATVQHATHYDGAAGTDSADPDIAE